MFPISRFKRNKKTLKIKNKTHKFSDSYRNSLSLSLLQPTPPSSPQAPESPHSYFYSTQRNPPSPNPLKLKIASENSQENKKRGVSIQTPSSTPKPLWQHQISKVPKKKKKKTLSKRPSPPPHKPQSRSLLPQILPTQQGKKRKKKKKEKKGEKKGGGPCSVSHLGDRMYEFYRKGLGSNLAS